MTVGIDSKDWLEIEAYLEKKERELLEKEGVALPEKHMDGYKYKPVTRIVEKQRWDCVPVPNGNPKCTSEQWTHTDLNFEVGEGIAYLTLNRPDDNNALNHSLSLALHDAVFELSKRDDIRCVVLRAEGKMFCAGGDPRHFVDAQAMSDADNRRTAVSFMKFLFYFQSLPQFTIALVQGSAMGSGIGLVAACDMVVSVQNARFQFPEVKLGMTPATVAPFVATSMGVANAKRALCTAENLTSNKAMEMGLVNEVVEDEADFSRVVSDVCEKLTLCAPKATAKSKRLVMNVAQRPINLAVMEYTGNELAAIQVGDEAVKGMVAVQAKVKPYWAETPIKLLY